MAHDIRHILGPGGLLAQLLDGYEPRPQQVSMAQAVAEAFSGDGKLVVEAATGTGKTLAYLVPALLSGRCVVVATATKALQEQIFDKDVPFLAKLFKKLRPARSFRAINIKGRTNYLCKLRFESSRDTVRLRTREDVKHFHQIMKWAITTKTGDRAEIPGLPDDYPAWSQLTATAQQCLGAECEKYDDCFVTRVRREAKEADLIVANHHLFFADLALRRSAVAPILPEYEAVIFDEAHHIEETITAYFGFEVSNWRMTELTGDVERTILEGGSLSAVAKEALGGVEAASEAFFGVFGVSDGRFELREQVESASGPEIQKAYEALRETLEGFGEFVGKLDLGDQAERLVERTRELLDDLARVMVCDNVGYAYIVERRGSGTFLECSPIDVARLFAREVLSMDGPQIFTSATLTAGESFDYFMSRLGMVASEVKTLKLAPVFDYAANALVYIPRRLPEPTHADYIDGVCQIVEYLVGLTDGRAFVLFTSYRNMELVWERLKDTLTWPLLKQGDAPRSELLSTFREDIHSVLFATGSFWEGVDVEGESLSLVIMDKLPFANPTDPLVKARTEHVRKVGGNPFMSYAVPQAAISLKQGFGRLIRSATDQGIVAILDSRVCTKRYGKVFLDTLPPATVVYNAREVKDWWLARQGARG